MKKILSFVTVFIIFLVTFSMIQPVAAQLSINVSWNLADINDDGFIDLVFTAVNLEGNPVSGVDVQVTPEDAQVPIEDTALLSGMTDANGEVVFKSIPGSTYVWATSETKNSPDLIQVEPFEFETTEEDLFLEWFLFMNWIPTESSNKGQVFLRSLAEFFDYDLATNPVPSKGFGDTNFQLSRKYLEWLGDLEDHVDLRKGSVPHEVWSFTKKSIALPKGVLNLAAQTSLPTNSRALLALSRTGRMRGGQWVQFSDYTLNNHAILLNRGHLMGWFAITFSVFDLLILAPEMDLIFDPSGDPLERWEMVFRVGADLATLASGITTSTLYAVALMNQLKELGRVPTQQLIATSKALGMVVVVLNIVLTVLHLWKTYETWENFTANFWTADVILSLVSLGISVTLLAVMIFNVAIPVVGWIIIGVTIIATLLYYLWDFFIGYWDKIKEYRIQLSGILTNLMDIREVLYSIDLQDLESSSALHSRFATIALRFATVASGDLKDNFLWANDYLSTLSFAEGNLAEKVEPAREALDQLIGDYLWYESADGTRRVKAHLEGINSTAAEYITGASSDHFTFNASIYHPSADDPSTFVFDKRDVNVVFDLGGNPLPSVSQDEVDYSAISTPDGSGWAWDPPAEHDNHKNLLGSYDRYFSVCYTTDTNHVPSGSPIGNHFYFDGNAQWYTGWPWLFDPNVYAEQSSIIPDPKTDELRSLYRYKFYFDPETTTDLFGHYNALEEWAENVESTLDSGAAQDRLEEVADAIDFLQWANARTQMSVTGVDVVLVIDRSGSMGGSKINSAKASAKQFADLMQFGDEIGVVSYSSSARVDFQLSEVISPDVKTSAKTAIDSIYASGMTAMGRGLRSAYDQLVAGGDSSHPWAIVLMSNGWHNTGEHPYNVIPALQAQNIAVYTVGLGPGADGALLGNIASQTGGFYRYSPTLIELVGIYNDLATRVTGAQTISSTEGSIAQGETSHQVVDVDSSAVQTTFTIGWEGSNLDLTLIRPDTDVVDPSVAAVDPNIEYIEEATYEMYRIGNPMPGAWTMVIVGIDIPAGSEDFIARVTAVTSVTLGLSTDRDSYVYPSPVKIIATIQDMGVGIKDASAISTVTGPDGEASAIVLFDDGLSEHGDRLLHDGVYTNFYTEFSEDGSYTIRVMVSGTTYSGEDFLRIAQKTVLVLGIPTDVTPPTTTLFISSPQYINWLGNIYVTSDTPITLDAVDNNGAGSGVASILYRISNTTYDSGWTTSVPPITFMITGLSDDVYNIDYYSIDNAGNVESTNTKTVILDNTSPLVTISNPPASWALQDGVTFTGSVTDAGSGVSSMNFSIREANDGEGIPIGFEDLAVSYDPITGEWSFSFNTLLVPDGYYVLYIEAEDNLGNEASTTVPYSIRNWAVIELLPSSEDNKAGRTMPVKFALRVAAEVDANQPFVYNEELRIEVFATADPDNVLQESYYGNTARDYRISSRHYVTNFKTRKRKPMEYTVAIYRDTFDVGSFTFGTVK